MKTHQLFECRVGNLYPVLILFSNKEELFEKLQQQVETYIRLSVNVLIEGMRHPPEEHELENFTSFIQQYNDGLKLYNESVANFNRDWDQRKTFRIFDIMVFCKEVKFI